jgi:hypothetical protein
MGLLRLLVGAIGLFNIVIGLGFLFNPAGLAAQFFLIPDGGQAPAAAGRQAHLGGQIFGQQGTLCRGTR